MEQKTNIRPEILQPFMESAFNAAEKGMSQFFTPAEFGRWCAQALPNCRQTIVDLNCGNGQLLQACALKDTQWLLGSDIDPVRSADGVHLRRISHDVTLLYAWLKEIDFRADLFVLNPPWRLLWHKERFAAMAESDLTAVRDAYATDEPGTPGGSLDSTIATIMMALDLCTDAGEGILIANNNTLDRLIFGPGAPFKMLAKHIWARVVVPGNPMTGLKDCLWEKENEFKTGVIYFAAAHTSGTTHYDYPAAPDRVMRMGREVSQSYFANDDTQQLWEAAREKVKESEDLKNGGRGANHYNVFLNISGRIGTALSLFESKSVRTNKKEADRLFKLTGKAPMELVLQRAERDDLLHVLDKGGWKVEPALRDAVAAAIQQYHAGRAPLYPLAEIQRLGYLDEQDSIECKRDLSIMRNVVQYKLETEDGEHTIYTPNSEVWHHYDDIVQAKKELKEVNAKLPSAGMQLVYQAGRKYSIRTQTVQVTRNTSKPNSFTGESEDLEFTGQELAIFIGNKVRDPDLKQDPDFEEFCFMDEKLRDGKTKVAEARQQKSRRRTWQQDPEAIPIDFSLQQLAEHFIIPDVPDVATNNPEQYKTNLDKLTEIEHLCAL